MSTLEVHHKTQGHVTQWLLAIGQAGVRTGLQVHKTSPGERVAILKICGSISARLRSLYSNGFFNVIADELVIGRIELAFL